MVSTWTFQQQIDIVFDYFRSERSNILMQRKTTPTLSGFRVNQYANYESYPTMV